MEDLNNLNNSQPEQTNRSFQISSIIISNLIRDMRFVGMFTIIYGVFNCLTIIGAIIGVPLIFMGIRLREGSDFLDNFKMNGDPQTLQFAFEKQYKYFNIQKIIIIISLVFFALYILVLIAFFSAFGWNEHYNDFSMLVQ